MNTYNNKIGSLYDGSYLATNTDNFTNFTPVLLLNEQSALLSIIDNNDNNNNPDIAVNYDIEGEDESTYPQYVTYIDHPIIKNKFNMENKPSSSSADQISSPSTSDPLDVNIHFDKIVHFYFGSLAVVGLFILFRSIQKSKY
jgi:hypothetical protein